MHYGYLLPDNYLAEKTIVSSARVASNTTVVFKAGESITLKPPFHAGSGSSFSASIGNCLYEEYGSREEGSPKPETDFATASRKDLEVKISPNPFRLSAKIAYYLPHPSPVGIFVRDQTGRILQTLNVFTGNDGWHESYFHSRDLPAGVYFVSLRTKEEIVTKKMVLAR